MTQYRSCKRCFCQMKGIFDYAARLVCYECGGEALGDSAKLLEQRINERKREREARQYDEQEAG